MAERFTAAGYATAAFLNNPWLGKSDLGKGFRVYEVYSRAPDEDVLAAGLEWIESPREQPFLAWIHLLDPHAPYSRRAGSAIFYESGYEGHYSEEALSYGMPLAVHDERELDRIRDPYDGEVRYVDELFGRLIDRLTVLGLMGSTSVVATADH